MRPTIILFLLFSSIGLCCLPASPAGVFIRVNQVGFLPEDIKTAVIFSNLKLNGKKYTVRELRGGETVFAGRLENPVKSGNFNEGYVVDFSSVKKSSKYYIEVDGKKSYNFSIGPNIYNRVVDSLMLFFKVQRCGYTNPMLHPVCHPFDATRVMDEGIEKPKADVTGGWHDAGDYIKFLNTGAFTTYMLLFAYEFDPEKFGFDNNHNGVADVLEEAKIGLDWMLRLRYSKDKFITQIQDGRDHDQGWRRPDQDQLAYDRPAFTGMGKNLIGIYCASMALASRIWREKLQYNEFADKCLQSAISLYSIRNNVPDLDKSASGQYQDSKFYGKLALGAVELFAATHKKEYLQDAFTLADQGRSDFWWSWGDVNALADYKLASYDKHFRTYIYENLKEFNTEKNRNIFGEAATDNWGSNNAMLGASLQAILWKKLTGDNTFDSLAYFQRDFIFGKNQWGISFVYNIGTFFSKNFHSQLAYFYKGYLPGAVAAGPISKKKLAGYKIELSRKDDLLQFQTEASVYHDDRMDYITNEPTITANATALFVIGHFSGKKR